METFANYPTLLSFENIFLKLSLVKSLAVEVFFQGRMKQHGWFRLAYQVVSEPITNLHFTS